MTSTSRDQHGLPNRDAASPRERLRRALLANRAVHEEYTDVPLEDLRAFQRWQSERLAQSYADFAAEPEFAPAVKFFLQDLYGPKDFRRRDREVERIYPGLIRVLPAALLDTLAMAIELNLLSAQLDREMVLALRAAGVALDRLDADAYADAYRAVGRYELRHQQLELVERLGADLREATGQRVLGLALRAARVPARLAGLQHLQRFLERGLDAFIAMPEPERFVSAVVAREQRFLAAVRAGGSG